MFASLWPLGRPLIRCSEAVWVCWHVTQLAAARRKPRTGKMTQEPQLRKDRFPGVKVKNDDEEPGIEGKSDLQEVGASGNKGDDR
ncbi:hypothetical protein NDU88_002119 [Pleurodeles waltl]|uniref:Uncharacterized protein n=1 Tax=Pleurodeles waltl TaxID=8319 RepID=A0AAV7NL44_PLEWA|nr:hypothetical protein NDU88_002119 [Pleurodeles waltl]